MGLSKLIAAPFSILTREGAFTLFKLCVAIVHGVFAGLGEGLRDARRGTNNALEISFECEG